MTTRVEGAVCPQCGHQGLEVNTEDWKPVAIKCPCRKCGWRADLRQFWAKLKGLSHTLNKGHIDTLILITQRVADTKRILSELDISDSYMEELLKLLDALSKPEVSA